MKANGTVIDDVIAVDTWKFPNAGPNPLRLFFLSHLHADHTVGLNSSWSLGPIYTSTLNCKMAPKFLPDSVCKVLTPLEMGVDHYLDLGDAGEDPKIRATLIDANHCPGAVMFLFQGFFGNVLYTGDFRYSPEILKNPSLMRIVQWEDVDRLYFDNTFFSPECNFKSREEVVDDCIKFLEKHSFHHIMIGCRRLGKEKAIVDLALRLKEKICVDEDKLELFTTMGLKNVFTTNPEDSRIQLVNQNLLTKTHLEAENKKRPIIGIILSALFYGWNDNPYRDSEKYGLYVFEYSDHSSYHEICDFIECVKPKVAIPIITDTRGEGFLRTRTEFLKNRINMETLDPFLSEIPPKIIKKIAFKGPPESNVKVRAKIAKYTNPKTRLYRGPKGATFESTTTDKSSQEARRSLRSISKGIKEIRNGLEPGKRMTRSRLQELHGHINDLKEHL